MYNWATLNQKVFRRLAFLLDKTEIDAIVACKPGSVEVLLMRLQRHIAEIRSGKRQLSASLSADGAHEATPYANYAAGSGVMAGSDVGGGGNGGAGTPAGYGGGGSGGAAMGSLQHQQQQQVANSGYGADMEALLSEKNATISELQETIEILELKVKKLEQVRGNVEDAPSSGRLVHFSASSGRLVHFAHPPPPPPPACASQGQPNPDADIKGRGIILVLVVGHRAYREREASV